MYRLFKAIRRLWIFAFCNHQNCCTCLAFEDSNEFVFCTRCGRFIYTTNEHDKMHNRHRLYPEMDFTRAERKQALTQGT